MTRTRLPRPGEVSEQCRLCAAALDVSLENPRRVCAACGEVNFPSEHSAPGVAPPAVVQRPVVRRPAPPKRKTSNETLLFWIGLASTGIPVFVVLALGELPGHRSVLWDNEATTLPVGASVALSLVPALWMIRRRKMKPVSLTLWFGGAVLGYLTVAPVAWVLFFAIAILSAL